MFEIRKFVMAILHGKQGLLCDKHVYVISYATISSVDLFSLDKSKILPLANMESSTYITYSFQNKEPNKCKKYC